jgi:hypothetical protein
MYADFVTKISINTYSSKHFLLHSFRCLNMVTFKQEKCLCLSIRAHKQAFTYRFPHTSLWIWEYTYSYQLTLPYLHKDIHIQIITTRRYPHTDTTHKYPHTGILGLCIGCINSIRYNTVFLFPISNISDLHFLDFQLFRPEHYWRDLISRNAHLVHQNW